MKKLAKQRRDVKLIRREEVRIELTFTPKHERFSKLDAQTRNALMSEVEAMEVTKLHSTLSGDVEFIDNRLNEFFTITVRPLSAEYDGGEVNTLNERYDYRVERY